MLTTTDIDSAAFRIELAPGKTNGLTARSFVMADKISTIPRAKLGRRSGQLAYDDVAKLDRAMLLFLGLSS